MVLAEEADIDEVFTLDVRGFQAYHIGFMEENHLKSGRDNSLLGKQFSHITYHIMSTSLSVHITANYQVVYLYFS
ncbi:MAG: hypothetical protein Q8M92_09555 [Candidatus Subteraquimicrobiales bacterium]|nr:hypothetical protein [Candidatus Subteraquimicrobiales bacterium]